MKNYSNKIDLAKFLSEVINLEYVIIKPDQNLPNYYSGSDIDIFCLNIQEFGRKILSFGNKYIKDGFEIKVEQDKIGKNLVIDFLYKDEIDFRFDLYQSLPQYKNIKIKSWLFYSVIDNRRILPKMNANCDCSIFVPSEIDDLILRYIEYYEWYKRRPDKIKHIDYIRDRIVSNSVREQFFNKLFLYTDLSSEEKRKEKFHIVIKVKRSIVFISQKINSTPIHHIPQKLFRLLRKTFRK